MYEQLLVPLDGSELAEKTLPYVEVLAPKLRAEVVLLRAVNIELLARYLPEGPLPPDVYQRVIDAETEAAADYLNGVAERLRSLGIATRVEVPLAPPASAILDAVAHARSTLITMATHGRTGLARFALGSVAELVVRGAEAPVLLVRALTEQPHALDPILVPLDGSPLAEVALPHAEALAVALAARVVLVRALDPAEAPEVRTALKEAGSALEPLPDWVLTHTHPAVDAAGYLKQIDERLRTVGIRDVRYEVVLGPAAEAILAAVARHGAGLIVMATHGRTGLQRWVMGSVADRVLHTVTVPLLLVRGHG